jgi:diaminopropionate ammonia-lyase
MYVIPHVQCGGRGYDRHVYIEDGRDEGRKNLSGLFQITKLLANASVNRKEPYPASLRDVLNEKMADEAGAVIKSWPGYGETPLISLDGLARAVGVKKVWYKDESARFGLRSFKALGGAYAVLRILLDMLIAEGEKVDINERDIFSSERLRNLARTVTVTCATDGNHGRSVAWGCQMLGCRCVIYLHEGVSMERQKAIESFGAEIVRCKGNYDDSVRHAAQDAATYNRIVVSDTSYPGYTDIPKYVMAGYTVMSGEIIDRIGPELSHVFVQGGVGGLAAALLAHFWMAFGNQRPHFLVIEPDKADCLYQSALAGAPAVVHGMLDTIMAGLACGEPSHLAWAILAQGADSFATIPDAGVPDAMRLLARSPYGDPKIEAGESAVAGLAFLLAAASRPEIMRSLGLDQNAEILVIGSEGATDPILYQRIIAGQIA